MNDNEQFMAAIIAEPANDMPRLAYADWLIEHGEDERAEFIQVQIKLASIEATIGPQTVVLPDNSSLVRVSSDRENAIRRREDKLLNKHWKSWVPFYTADKNIACTVVDPIPSPTITELNDGCLYLFRRGFIAVIIIRAAEWGGGRCEGCYGRGEHSQSGHGNWRILDCPNCHGTGRTTAYGPMICRAQPVEELTLSGPSVCLGMPWSSHRIHYGLPGDYGCEKAALAWAMNIAWPKKPDEAIQSA